MKFGECISCENEGNASICRGCRLVKRPNGEWGGSDFSPIEVIFESTNQARQSGGGGEAGKHEAGKDHLLKVLKEYQDYRRGTGSYAWNEIPEKNKEFPYSPKEVGEAIDEAIRVLSNVAKGE